MVVPSKFTPYAILCLLACELGCSTLYILDETAKLRFGLFKQMEINFIFDKEK